MESICQKLSSKDVKKTVLIVISSLLYSLSMNTFVENGNLFPGGIAGITRLITQVGSMFSIEISFSTIYFILNAVVAIIFGRSLGRNFTLYSVIWFTLTSIFTSVLPIVHLTQDIILISIFGGILAGLGTSLALNQNASSGGLDFVAMYFSNKFGVSMWSYLFAFNCLVLFNAGYLFGWDKALYSIIYQFAYTQIVNMMHERYKHVSLFIITKDPEPIEKQIYAHTTHSLTKFWGEGGFAHQKECLIFTTITMDEYDALVKHIKEVEPKAFITVNSTEKIIGRFIQKPFD